MGGRGPVYQFASMSSVREVRTPSPHATVWLLSMLRALRRDIQDFEKSRSEIKNYILIFKASDRRAIDFKNPAASNFPMKRTEPLGARIQRCFPKEEEETSRVCWWCPEVLQRDETKTRRLCRWGGSRSLQTDSTSNMEGAGVLNPLAALGVGDAEPTEIRCFSLSMPAH